MRLIQHLICNKTAIAVWNAPSRCYNAIAINIHVRTLNITIISIAIVIYVQSFNNVPIKYYFIALNGICNIKGLVILITCEYV